MQPGHQLYYLRHKEIDRSLWDKCIDTATNELLYAKSYYMDAICKNWDAIILNNYEAVMPLPWKKKYGITYVYPPPFMQQLGMFSTNPSDTSLLSNMLKLAESKFKFGEYYLNFKNHHLPTEPKANFTLSLNMEYAAIAKNYKQDLVKNLKKARHYQLQYTPTTDYAQAIQLYQSIYGHRTPHVTPEDYIRLTNACNILYQKKEVIIREVKNTAGALLACTLCLKDTKRIYLLLSTTTGAGRHMEANHFMIDCLINEFAGQPFLFDFEGSDILGIAHFYKNFGSSDQPYFFYRWNNLPWPISLLKEK